MAIPPATAPSSTRLATRHRNRNHALQCAGQVVPAGDPALLPMSRTIPTPAISPRHGRSGHRRPQHRHAGAHRQYRPLRSQALHLYGAFQYGTVRARLQPFNHAQYTGGYINDVAPNGATWWRSMTSLSPDFHFQQSFPSVLKQSTHLTLSAKDYLLNQKEGARKGSLPASRYFSFFFFGFFVSFLRTIPFAISGCPPYNTVLQFALILQSLRANQTCLAPSLNMWPPFRYS